MKHKATDSEQQIIGSLLLEPPLIDKIAGRVQPRDFVDPYHRAAYAAILAMDKAGDPIGAVPLLQRLKDEPLFRSVEASAYIAEAAEATPTSAHVSYHCRRIAEAARRRKLVEFAESALKATDDGKSSAEILAGLGAEVEDLGREFRSTDPDTVDALKTAKQIVRDYLDDIERGVGEVVETGIDGLDYALSGGLCYGEMAIIAGRPSHGKTMVGLHILDDLCGRGHECLLLSEEMGSTMLAQRFLHRITPIGPDRWMSSIDTLRNDAELWAKGRTPLYIAPPCGTVGKAISIIDNAARRGLRIVAVDYLQLLRGSGQGKYEQTSDVSQRLREAASRHDLLMLCLCQLSRKSEEHQGAPRLSDLRDSGQLEQDADVVMFVDWPSLRGERIAGDVFFVRIRKNRNRETRCQDVELRIDRRRQTVSTLSIEEVYEWEP